MSVIWTDRNFERKHLLILSTTSIENIRSEARRRIDYRSMTGGGPNRYEGMAALLQTFGKNEFGPTQAPRNTLLAMTTAQREAWAAQIENGMGTNTHGNHWRFTLPNVFLIEADPAGNMVEAYGATVEVAIDTPAPGTFHVVHLGAATPLAVTGATTPSPFQVRHDRKTRGGCVPIIGSEDLSDELNRWFS